MAKRTSVYIDDSLYWRIQRIAQLQHRSISSVLRLAVQEYIAKYQEPEEKKESEPDA